MGDRFTPPGVPEICIRDEDGEHQPGELIHESKIVKIYLCAQCGVIFWVPVNDVQVMD